MENLPLKIDAIDAYLTEKMPQEFAEKLAAAKAFDKIEDGDTVAAAEADNLRKWLKMQARLPIQKEAKQLRAAVKAYHKEFLDRLSKTEDALVGDVKDQEERLQNLVEESKESLRRKLAEIEAQKAQKAKERGEALASENAAFNGRLWALNAVFVEAKELETMNEGEWEEVLLKFKKEAKAQAEKDAEIEALKRQLEALKPKPAAPEPQAAEPTTVVPESQADDGNAANEVPKLVFKASPAITKTSDDGPKYEANEGRTDEFVIGYNSAIIEVCDFLQNAPKQPREAIIAEIKGMTI